MDFLLYKSNNSQVTTSPKIELCEDQQTGKLVDYFYATRPSTFSRVDSSGKQGIFISGKIKYKDFGIEQSLDKLLGDVVKENWPLSNDYDGMFSGVAFSGDKVVVFNDPIGMWHLYYSFTRDALAVTTNLNAMHKLINAPLKLSALVLEASGGEFTQYGTSTVLENVFTLMPGELKVLQKGNIHSLYDTTIKQEDRETEKGFADNLVEFINEKSRKFFNDETKFIASLSGGIDSRVNIAALGTENFDYHFVNYGKAEFIDSKIPNKIADKLKKPIEIIDSTPWQFPQRVFLEKSLKETDSLKVNQWFAVENNNKLNIGYQSFLLGDMCDILRSKGVSSIKTRNFRRKFYIRKFLFNKGLELKQISEADKEQFKKIKLNLILTNVENAMDFLRIAENERNVVLQDIKIDVEELFNHLDRYNPKYIESYEELFGIFTHGRKSMGKQLNFLKVRFMPFIPLQNLQIIRKVLNYSPMSRYSDELTNAMFKHTKWKFLGKFPTNQNPFIAYNSNYYLMLFGWFLRSSIDQVLIKLHVRTKGRFKRQRLFKSVDIHATYAYPHSKINFMSYFNQETDTKNIIDTFNGRLNKTKWPLQGMDLIPYVQTSFYYNMFSKKDNEDSSFN